MDGFPLASVVDLALAVIAVELVVIALARRRGGSLALLPTVLSGLGLLLALRVALAGADPRVTLAALSFGGLAHGADLVFRLRRGSATG